MEEPGTLQSRDHDHHDLVDGEIEPEIIRLVVGVRSVVGGDAERQAEAEEGLEHELHGGPRRQSGKTRRCSIITQTISERGC